MRKRTPDGYMPVEIHFLNNEPTPHIGPVERKHGYVNVPQSDDTDFTQEDW